MGTILLPPTKLIGHPDCTTHVPADLRFIYSASIGETMNCATCGKGYEFWDLLIASLADKTDPWHPVSLVGGGSLFFAKSVTRGEIFKLDLSEYGVPEDARVYRLAHTVQPVDHHLPVDMILSPIIQQVGTPLSGNFFNLWPVEPGFFDGSDWTECEVAFWVDWAPSAGQNELLQFLLESFGAFGEDDLRKSILHAHLAVDLVTSQPTLDILRSNGSLNTRAPGLSERLAIAASIARVAGIAILDHRVIAEIAAMNKARNHGIAHLGKFETTTDAAARMIAATACVVAYFQLQGADLVRAGSPSDQPE